MNPSRLFIQRPVATSLLMVAMLLAGIMAYRLLPMSALPEVDYPTIQVITLYPGASPDVMTSTVTAPLERQFGQMPGLEPDVVDELGRRVGDHAAVLARTVARHRRAGGAGGDQRANSLLPTDLPLPPIYSKVNPADAPILTLAVTSPTMPLPRVHDLVETRIAQKIVAGAGRRPRQHRRRPAPGRAHPGEPACARVVRPQPRRPAHDDRHRQRQPGQGQLRRPDARLHDRRQRPAALGRRVPEPDHRVPQERRRAPQGRRRRHRRRREHAPRRLGERPRRR